MSSDQRSTIRVKLTELQAQANQVAITFGLLLELNHALNNTQLAEVLTVVEDIISRLEGIKTRAKEFGG
jgi:hypothetical protein